MLLFVPPARHEQVRQRLSGLLNVPFQFDSAGTQIVFYDPGQDYSEAAAIRSAQELRPFREWVHSE